MAGKRRAKRDADTGELTSLWLGFNANQAWLEKAFGADGAAEARRRAVALLAGGWGAAWELVD